MVSRRLEYSITATDSSARAFKSAQASAKSLEDRINGITSTGQRLQRVFGAITLGVGAGSAIQEMNTLEQQMIRLRGVSSNFASDQQFLIQTSKDLGLNLKNLTASFTDLQVLESLELLSEGEARGLAVGFEQASAKFGTSSADIILAVRGLRQGLTQGILRAQEFDQIFDALGAAQPLVAKQLGLTTQAFQKLRTANTLVAADVASALNVALNSLDGAAQERAESIQGSFNKIATGYQQVLLAFQEPVSDLFQGIATDALVPAFSAIAENSGLIATATSATAAGLTLAYGGRRIAELTSFATAQTRLAVVTRSHSEALIENSRLEQVSSKQTIVSTQATLSAVTAQRQQLQTYLASNQALRLNAGLQAQLVGLRSQEGTLARTIASANRENVAATKALSSSRAAAAITTRTLAGATTALNGAMSLVGGPAGAAAIAIGLVAFNAFNLNKELRDIADLNEKLVNAGNISQINSGELTAARTAAEQKINDLLNERDKLLKDGQNYSIGPGDTAELNIISLNDRIAELQADLFELNQNEIKLISESSTKTQVDQIGRLDDVLGKLQARTDAGEALLGKLLPNEAKIADLKTSREELEKIADVISPERYEAASKSITDQINKLNGLTEARKKASDQQTKSLKALERLEESLLTERQRLQKEFEDTEKNVLELQVSLGDEQLSDDRVASLVATAREKLDVSLEELNSKLIREEERRIQEVTDARQAKLKERNELETALRELQSPIDGLSNVDAINQRFAIEQDALASQFDFKLGLDAAYVTSSLQLERDRQAQITAIQEQAKQNRTTAIDLGVGLSSAFFDAFQRDVGSYVSITEDMTAADQARAEASNIINKKIFNQNKKAQKANAVIEGLGAVAKAFNAYPPPFGAIAAITAGISAAATVNKINRTSFDGGGTVSFSGSSSSVGTSGTSTLDSAIEANSSSGGNTVYLVTQVPSNLQGALDPDWMYQNQQESLRRMAEDDIISIDAEQIVVADSGVPQSLRSS